MVEITIVASKLDSKYYSVYLYTIDDCYVTIRVNRVNFDVICMDDVNFIFPLEKIKLSDKERKLFVKKLKKFCPQINNSNYNNNYIKAFKKIYYILKWKTYLLKESN